MNTPSKRFNLTESKIRASIVLKALRSEDSMQSNPAITRFQALPEFAECSAAAIQEQVRRKHALALIAKEAGFSSWNEFKLSSEASILAIFTEIKASAFLNKWFSNYDQAKIEQMKSGGYLLPYNSQCFICEADYIKHIGLNPNDPDWKLMAWDWVKPADSEARERQYKKFLAIHKKDVA
ncbi:MAG: hypothetical protein Q7V63_09495 [Gammaproteobacteria bacterium]|nr:hypothetical protein [Gammaproteobacteria bacterium]